MAAIDYSINKRPEKVLGEKKMSDRETYLLKALLNLLLYTGMVKAGDGGDLFFVSGESQPNQISGKTLINMG